MRGYYPDDDDEPAIDDRRNLRPGWLAGGDWRDQLDALTVADRSWFARQWELAGGAPPQTDTSWLTTTAIR